MTIWPRPLRPVDGLLVLLLSVLDFRLFVVLAQAVFPNNPSAGVEIPFKTSVLIVMGEPPWRVFQGRILGPWTMELFHLVGLDYVPAFLVMMLLAVVVKNVVALTAFAQLSGTRTTGWALTLTLACGFWLIQNGQPLYPWDVIECTIATLLVLGAAMGYGAGFFLVLIAVALINRESALFIGLFVVAQGLFPASRGARLFDWKSIDRAQVMLGGMMIGAGAALIEGIRTLLFKRSTMLEGILYSGVEYNPYAQVKLVPNLEMFWNGLTQFPDLLSPFINLKFALNALIVATLAIGIVRWRWLLRNEAALAATLAAELGAVLVFATIHEGRVFAGLLPLMVYLGWRLGGGVVARER